MENANVQEISLLGILYRASLLSASDVHITAGSRPVVRVDGKIRPLD